MCESRVNGCQLLATTTEKAHFRLWTLNPDWMLLLSVMYKLSSKLINSFPAILPKAARQATDKTRIIV
jgi:hypothetical protein